MNKIIKDLHNMFSSLKIPYIGIDSIIDIKLKICKEGIRIINISYNDINYTENSNQDTEITEAQETQEDIENSNHDIEITEEHETWEDIENNIEQIDIDNDNRWGDNKAINTETGIKNELIKESHNIEVIDNTNDITTLEDRIKELEAEYHKKEFPEETMETFIETESLISVSNADKYIPTPIMHDFEIGDNTEYDKYANPHHAYISDFFPVSNMDANRLIRTIRRIKNEGIINQSAEDIYKHWLLYLKNFGADYKLYDWRNYNDLGEFLNRNEYDDDVLEQYMNDITNTTIMYDEAADKIEAEKKFQDDVKRILESGEYKSDIDPHLTDMFIRREDKTDINITKWEPIFSDPLLQAKLEAEWDS